MVKAMETKRVFNKRADMKGRYNLSKLFKGGPSDQVTG